MFLLYFLTYLKIVHIFHNILEKVKKYYARLSFMYNLAQPLCFLDHIKM